MQQQSQQLASLEAIARQSAADVERVTRERDEALREVQHLKKLLKKKEESFLTTEEELIKARQARTVCWIMLSLNEYSNTALKKVVFIHRYSFKYCFLYHVCSLSVSKNYNETKILHVNLN